MTLIIDDETFASVLTMAPCIEALDTAFREYTPGGAVNRPRSHTYTRLDDGRHYLFKSMGRRDRVAGGARDPGCPPT
jgi:hypothetical protein